MPDKEVSAPTMDCGMRSEGYTRPQSKIALKSSYIKTFVHSLTSKPPNECTLRTHQVELLAMRMEVEFSDYAQNSHHCCQVFSKQHCGMQVFDSAPNMGNQTRNLKGALRLGGHGGVSILQHHITAVHETPHPCTFCGKDLSSPSPTPDT